MDDIDAKGSSLAQVSATDPVPVAECIAAWEQVLDALIAIGDGLTSEEWDVRTECPEWTVKDVYAHLVGVDAWFSAGRPPMPDRDTFTDAPVRARHGVDGPTVLAELRHERELRRAWSIEPPDPGEPATLVFVGPMPMWLLMRFRVTDLWMHEQDVRRAVGQPGDLDTLAAQMSVQHTRTGLPEAVSGGVADPGSLIRFTVTGPIRFEDWLAVDADRQATVIDPDGLPAGVGPTTHVSLGSEDFARLVAGRIPAERASCEVSGDLALARRVLANLAMIH
jgi:uncharacterized protein (TIGR03083 family)